MFKDDAIAELSASSFQDGAAHSTICFCSDCRKQSGTPMLAWAMFHADDMQGGYKVT